MPSTRLSTGKSFGWPNWAVFGPVKFSPAHLLVSFHLPFLLTLTTEETRTKKQTLNQSSRVSSGPKPSAKPLRRFRTSTSNGVYFKLSTRSGIVLCVVVSSIKCVFHSPQLNPHIPKAFHQRYVSNFPSLSSQKNYKKRKGHRIFLYKPLLGIKFWYPKCPNFYVQFVFPVIFGFLSQLSGGFLLLGKL